MVQKYSPLAQDCECVPFFLTKCVQLAQERDSRPGLFPGLRTTCRRHSPAGPAGQIINHLPPSIVIKIIVFLYITELICILTSTKLVFRTKL